MTRAGLTQINPQPILARPSDRPHKVIPRNPLQERFPLDRLHCPIPDRDPHIVEPGLHDLREILFGDEGLVVLSHDGFEVDFPSLIAEGLGEGEFVDGLEVWFE
jgi:hypothetical protein